MSKLTEEQLRMNNTITGKQRIGTYYHNSNRKREVDMRKGILHEIRGGNMTHRPVFFFVRRGVPVIVMRHILARDWSPVYGSHVCGDQENKQRDLLAPMGDNQNTTWEAWNKK